MDEAKFLRLAFAVILFLTEASVEAATQNPDSWVVHSTLASRGVDIAPALPHVDPCLRSDLPSTTAEIAASGGVLSQGYVLQLRPHWIREGWKVPIDLTLDIVALPTFPGEYLLKRDVSLERACSLLGKVRTRKQLRAVRANLLRGLTTEIGGNVPFARFVFSERQIRKLRLGFYSAA